MKSEGEEWTTPKKVTKAGTRSMDVDGTEIVPSYFDELLEEQEYDEMQRIPCESFFHRH